MDNKEEDKFFCLLDAPNREAVENHHNKHGVKCEWITEVKNNCIDIYYSINLIKI